MKKEVTVVYCDNCGKRMDEDPFTSPETKFTRPDLDYNHGIWLGEVGVYYIGASKSVDKEFCSLDCLIEDIRKFYQTVKQQRDFERLGGVK